MTTGRWSELTEEHEVRYNENGRFFATAMSRTSGVADEINGLVAGVSGPKIVGVIT